MNNGELANIRPTTFHLK